MTQTVQCGNCGKDSGVERNESDGTTGANLVHIGWKVKLPVLVGICNWYFACSDTCMRGVLTSAYQEHSITDEDIQKATKVTNDFKAKIPAMAKETCEMVGRLQNALTTPTNAETTEERL